MGTASQLSISNLAIGKLPANPIAAVGENSLEARECRRFYQQVVDEMLQGPHDWSFANRRMALALVGTNGRDREWLYAYAVPSDMGTPIRLLPDLEGVGAGLPVPLPGESYAERWSGTLDGYCAPYIIENGTLYSNVQNAVLEYGISSIEESNLLPLVVEALAADLAFRLAVPVKKDRKLKQELFQEKELAWSRAIADDFNRHPQHYGEYVSDAMRARSGYSPAVA